MGRIFIAVGAVLGLIGVATGAFGAHALKTRLSADHLAVWETASRYNLYHAIALVLIGLFATARPSAIAHGAGWAMVGGVAIFSGSLYVLCLSGIRWLGAITPIGGVALMVGWALFAVAAWKS